MSSETDFENVNSNKSDSGVKLPYFHRVLSKEDTELIGNIAPPKISEPIIDNNEEKKLSSSSKWNSAGKFTFLTSDIKSFFYIPVYHILYF